MRESFIDLVMIFFFIMAGIGLYFYCDNFETSSSIPELVHNR